MCGVSSAASHGLLLRKWYIPMCWPMRELPKLPCRPSETGTTFMPMTSICVLPSETHPGPLVGGLLSSIQHAAFSVCSLRPPDSAFAVDLFLMLLFASLYCVNSLFRAVQHEWFGQTSLHTVSFSVESSMCPDSAFFVLCRLHPFELYCLNLMGQILRLCS